MTDVRTELERLAALRDRGMLTEADYQAQRARLLQDAAEAPAARRGHALKLIGLLVSIVLLVLALAALGRCSHRSLKLPAGPRAPNMIPASRSPPVAMGTGQMTKATQPGAGDANQQASEPAANGN